MNQGQRVIKHIIIPVLLVGFLLSINIENLTFFQTLNSPHCTKTYGPSDVGDQYEYDILAGQYHVLHIEFEQHLGIYGRFDVTENENITLFVLDDEQYELFQNRQPHTTFIAKEKVTNGSILFKPPKTAMWHFVFNNRYSIVDKHVHFELYLDQTPPIIMHNLTQGVTYSTSDIGRFVIEESIFYVYVQVLLDGVEIKDHLTETRIVIIDIEFSNLDLGGHNLFVNVSDTVGNWDSLNIDFSIVDGTITVQSSTTSIEPTPSGHPDILFLLVIVALFIGVPVVCITILSIIHSRFIRKDAEPTEGRKRKVKTKRK